MKPLESMIHGECTSCRYYSTIILLYMYMYDTSDIICYSDVEYLCLKIEQGLSINFL